MNLASLISQIKHKDFNKQHFVDLIIKDEIARDIVVGNLLNNDHIMVYYHCYYVVDLATQQKPELFYNYFNNFQQLLFHKNSYHRDIALTLLANLAVVDTENKLNKIFSDYLTLIHDKKFMTGNSCVKNLAKIYKSKPKLVISVLPQLLTIELESLYSEKQLELLKYDILVLVDLAFASYVNQKQLIAYIEQATHSLSPKTKKKAKELCNKYCLL